MGYPHFRKPPYRNQDKHRPSGPQVILDSDWRWHPRYALLPSVTSAISNSGAHCMYPSLSSNVAGKSIMSSDDRKHIENLHSYNSVYIYIHTNYIYSGFPISMFDYQMVHASCELNYVHTILPAKCCDPKDNHSSCTTLAATCWSFCIWRVFTTTKILRSSCGRDW